MTDKGKLKEKSEASSEKPEATEEGSGETIPQGDFCQKAPEWAEHSRLHDEDQPCDDGRSGNLEQSSQKD